MDVFAGKTIKDIELNKGTFCLIFEDGSVASINLYLSDSLSKACVNEIRKSIADEESHLFAALRDN